MSKKNVIKILVFVTITLLAILFMFLGAKEQGRKYNIEQIKDYKYFVLQKAGKYGVIDKQAKQVLDIKYENIIIPNPAKPVFFCIEENGIVKILNEKQEEKYKNYEEVSYIKIKNIENELPYEKSVLKYKQNGKYGLIDYEGSKITEAIYDSIDSLGYKEGEFIVEQKGKYGVINLKGINLVPIEYQTIKADEYYNEEKYYKDGYIVGIRTQEGYRYGYMDVDGKKILDNEYNEITRLQCIPEIEGIYLVASKNGQYGLYKNEEQILKHNYQSITYNEENNILLLEKSKKYGISDLNGKTILDVKYLQIDLNGKNLYAKENEEKTDVYDLKGKLTNIKPNTSKQEVENGKYTIVAVSEEDKTLYGIEDKEGKELVKPKYYYLEYLGNNNFKALNEEGKIGIIDEKGEIKLELKYNLIQKVLDNKLIEAKEDEENTTYIYSEKLELIKKMSDAIVKENEDNLLIYNNTEKEYITNSGKVVPSYQILNGNQYYSSIKNGKWGFVDEKNNVKVDYIYDKVTEFNKYGFAGIKTDGKWGVIDKELKVILEPKYQFEDEQEPDFLGIYYKIQYGEEILYSAD